MVELWSALMVPAVAVNVADVKPAAIATEAGTVSSAFVFESVTDAPPVSAAPLSVTVQVVLAELLTVDGAHERDVIVGTRGAPPVTIPPVPVMAVPLAELEAAMPLVTAIVVLIAPGAINRLMTATVPFDIVPAFMPETRHVYVPTPAVQFSVLLALVAAAPTIAEMEATLVEG
jgi:hypothetical protein